MGEVLMRNQVVFARALPKESLYQREVTRRIQSDPTSHSTVVPVKEQFTERICYPQGEKHENTIFAEAIGSVVSHPHRGPLPEQECLPSHRGEGIRL